MRLPDFLILSGILSINNQSPSPQAPEETPAAKVVKYDIEEVLKEKKEKTGTTNVELKGKNNCFNLRSDGFEPSTSRLTRPRK